jgi:predicted CXXCH cytochrome family protein
VKIKKGVYFILLAVCVLVAQGCDKYTNYKILTFLFTGVPHPEKQTDLLTMKKQTIAKDTDGDDQVVNISSTHGPYAAGQCFLCHELNTMAALKKGAKGEGEGASMRFDSNLPGRLLSPIEKLCLECHPTKSMESAFSQNLWIHGPVSTGTCIACHNPHSTQYRYMLRKGNSNEMCTICHAPGFISQSEDHIEGKDCISCHNAHLGKNRFLLRKDYNEVY